MEHSIIKRLTVHGITAYVKISLRDLGLSIAGSGDHWSCLVNRFKVLLLPFEDGTIKIGNYHVRYHTISELLYMQNEIFGDEVYAIKIRDHPFIIDAGANIGLATLYLKRHYPDAEILAFEPGQPYEYYIKNIKNNRLNGISVARAALSGENGVALMYTDDGNSLSASLYGAGEVTEPVDTVRLSNYIKRTVDLLKLDVEGSEIPIIDELVRSGKLSMIEHIIMEYHQTDPGQMVDTLRQNGFNCTCMANDPAHVQHVQEHQYIIKASR